MAKSNLMANLLIYGANGYTGSLIAQEAVRRDYKPILAGRNPEALAVLAKKLALEHRVFSLDDPAAVDAGLRGVSTVLHSVTSPHRKLLPRDLSSSVGPGDLDSAFQLLLQER